MAGLIELNADVGEGCNDAPLFSCVNRVSIACGGHTGDRSSMATALRLSEESGILAGAHPSYPDRENFGRLPMATKPGEIENWLLRQVMQLMDVAERMGVRVFHVKPHGALYNEAASNRLVAEEVISAIGKLPNLVLIALAGSPLVAWAREAGIEVLQEGFADRRYLSNGQLAPRSVAGAVIEQPEVAAEQARLIARGELLNTLDKARVRVRVDTLCLHGDTKNALQVASAVKAALDGL